MWVKLGSGHILCEAPIHGYLNALFYNWLRAPHTQDKHRATNNIVKIRTCARFCRAKQLPRFKNYHVAQLDKPSRYTILVTHDMNVLNAFSEIFCRTFQYIRIALHMNIRRHNIPSTETIHTFHCYFRILQCKQFGLLISYNKIGYETAFVYDTFHSFPVPLNTQYSRFEFIEVYISVPFPLPILRRWWMKILRSPTSISTPIHLSPSGSTRRIFSGANPNSPSHRN